MTKPMVPKNKVNPKIVKALNTLLDEVMKAPAEGDAGKSSEKGYTLTDKMKVLDRALKLEAIRLKVTDEEGSFFGDRNRKGQDDETE